MTLVTCGTCAHYQADAINPRDGAGLCAIDAWPHSLPDTLRGRPWPPSPRIERYCSKWRAP